MAQQRTRIVAGCMTGTSLDGLDVALVKIIGTGLEMKAELLGHHAQSLPADLRTTLMSLASGEANEPIAYMRAARALGELHADGIERLAGGLGPSSPSIDFVTAHGQTIWHAPRDEQGPKSWQLFDPWPIVKRLGFPVCYDLRQADLIAGGEGAPLTPIADWVMYRSTIPRTVVNLGGICNYTYLGVRAPDSLTASDTFACNLLIDGIVQKLLPNKRFDQDGETASTGQILDFFKEYVTQDRIKHAEAVGDIGCSFVDCYESLGREIFDDDWVNGFISAAPPRARTEDILCSAVSLVANHVPLLAGEVILAGGGAKNQFLVDCIRKRILPGMNVKSLILSDDLGIPCEAREAMGFAVLGALSQDGVPISLPQVTGATDPGVAGVWAGV